ncbi:MAG: lamin tail domain-containing protein [Candidatus Pacearchaeota archaeon]|nr:MAG: lamin tail domain-containing protein [Candidatus Pacearchaeota archaeon]
MNKKARLILNLIPIFILIPLLLGSFVVPNDISEGFYESKIINSVKEELDIIDPPPTLQFFSDTQHTNTTAVLTAIATDYLENAGIRWIKIYEDGQEWEYKDCGGQTTCTFVKVKVETQPANHTYYAETKDLGNHVVQSDPITIWFEGLNQLPIIDDYVPQDLTPEINEGETLHFEVWAHDPNNDPLFYTWKLDGQEVSTISSYDYNPDYNASGLHDVYVIVYDNKGGTVTLVWNVTVINVLLNTTCYLNFDPTSPITYSTPLNASCYCTNPEAPERLWRNNINIDNENNVFVIIEAGTHNYTCNVTQTPNYQGASNSSLYVINPVDHNIRLTLDGQENDLAVPYNSTTNATGWLEITQGASNALLYRDFQVVASGSPATEIALLGVDLYNYTYYYPASQNYTEQSLTRWLNVTQGISSCTLNFVPPSPITYDQQPFIASCSCTNPEAGAELWRDGVNVTNENNLPITLVVNPAGYNYVCNVTATQNYTGASTSALYVINQATTILTLTAQPSWNVTYGIQTNVSCSANNNEVTINLYRNGQIVNNPDIATLGAGNYNYVCNTTGSQNWTAASVNNILNVNQAASIVDLRLNGIDNNITVNISELVNMTGRLIIPSNPNPQQQPIIDGIGHNEPETDAIPLPRQGLYEIYLYLDIQLINIGNHTVTNVTSFNQTGIHNVTVIYPGSQNFSSSYETHWINVSGVGDTEPPVVTLIFPPNSSTTSENVTVIYNVTDNIDVLLDCNIWSDTSGIWQIDGSQQTANATNGNWNYVNLVNGIYTWNIECIDDSANSAFAIENWTFIVNVSVNQPPVVTLLSPANGSVINTTNNVTAEFGVVDELLLINCTLWHNITGSWLPNQSQMAMTGVVNSFDITEIPNDYYIWNVECNDTEYSVFAPDNWTFTINYTGDLIPPDVWNVSANPQVINQSDSTQIEAFARDNVAIDTVLAQVTYPDLTQNNFTMIPGMVVFQYLYNFTDTLQIGNYSVRIFANDTSNNWNTTETTWFFVQVIPGYGNTTTIIIQPANNSIFNLTDIFITEANVTAVGGDVVNCNATITFSNGNVLTTPQAVNVLGNIANGTTKVTQWNVTAAAVGSSDITITTTCEFGGSSSDTVYNITVTEDTEPPVVIIESPLNITYSVNDILINITATDDNAVDQIWFNYNGTNVTYTVPFIETFEDGFYIMDAWANDTSGNIGSDQVMFTVNTTAPAANWIVFSEVLYDAVTPEDDNEWIELYNPTSQDIDISGWTIQDNNGTWVIPNGTIIGTGKFISIARNGTAYYNMYSLIPHLEGLTLRLANSGDILRLYNASNEIDMVSWEDFIAGWPNYANENFSTQRQPPWQDTNTSADWTNNSIPTPVGTILSLGVDIWADTYYQEILPGINATYTIFVNNTGTSPNTFNLSVQNLNNADIAALDIYQMTLNAGETQNTTLYVSDTTPGIYNVTVTATDSDNSSVFDITNNITTNVTVLPDMPPWYLNEQVNPTSPTVYGPGPYNFTIEWLDNVAVYTVIFEFDNQNYTPNCNPGLPTADTNCSYVFTDLGVGNYNYRWYANDTINQWNSTLSLVYIINKQTSTCSLSFAPPSPITYDQQPFIALCSCTNPEANAELWRDGLNVTNENNLPVTLTANPPGYNYTCNVTATQNYTGASVNAMYIINQATSEVNLTLNGTDGDITVNVSEIVNITCHLIIPTTGYIEVYDNSILINNGSAPLENLTSYSSEGLHNITCAYPSTQNYTASSETHWINVTSVMLPGEVHLWLNGTEGNLTITYNNENLKFNASTPYGNVSIRRNGTLIAGPAANYVEVFENLPAGYYNFTAYSTGDENHSSASVTYFLTINKLNSSLTLLLNDQNNDITIIEGENVNHTGMLNIPTTGDLSLLRNGTQFAFGPSPLIDISIYNNPGYYNITSYYAGNENYSEGSATHFITVLEAIHDISVDSIELIKEVNGTNKSISSSTVWLYDIVYVKANVSNVGNQNETNINVTLEDNSVPVDWQLINLDVGQTQEVTLLWNVNNDGWRTVKVKSLPVPGETNLANNEQSQDIRVWKVCDVIDCSIFRPITNQSNYTLGTLFIVRTPLQNLWATLSFYDLKVELEVSPGLTILPTWPAVQWYDLAPGEFKITYWNVTSTTTGSKTLTSWAGNHEFGNSTQIIIT